MKVKVNSNNLIIKKKKDLSLIPLSNILYIEKFGNISVIKTKQHEFEVRITLKDLVTLLPQYFIRSHRSYIINTRLVTKLKHMKNDLYKVVFNIDDYDYAFLKKKEINKIIND
ncbi:LytTR family transcriptional regulator DNA-binding domain-containing protein [Dethiothermospora halolimnae]|uniref:LytTR family transcriptional regulator DNA-binding domain-containing protein n=1 Tax=Dethiothermospora halolimnae TaxID=3114390 RepID=UPI003CCC277B